MTVTSPLNSSLVERSLRRQSKAASEDNRRTSHYSRSGAHATKDPNAKEDHNDGEWMYNLDALATEHRTKHRK